MSLTKNSGSGHGAARKILQREWKVTKRGTSAVDWDTFPKFGLQMDVDVLKLVMVRTYNVLL